MSKLHLKAIQKFIKLELYKFNTWKWWLPIENKSIW
jgi:hypothetical protein